MSQTDNKSRNLKFLCLEDWLQWQESLHFTAVELGLERCRQVADNMGLLHPQFHIIAVGGTNGKGSCVELLRLILSHAGYRVGCYTSPHLIRYNERITIDGIEASDECLCESFSRIDNARNDISLTYFEFGTLSALDIFREQQVNIAILEVGMGGRLDAVNVFDADVALISSIDLDHQQWLGDTREIIAREKAGIFRFRAPAVCADANPPKSLLACAKALGTPLSVNGIDFHYHLPPDSWNWYCGDTKKTNLPRPTQYCDYQIQNAAGVLTVLSELSMSYPVTDTDIIYGLQNFHLPGRFQIIPGICRIVLDVAHNQQAIQMLVANLQLLGGSGHTHVILGLMADKYRQGMYKELLPIVDSWHVVGMSSTRACSNDTLAEELQQYGIQSSTISRHISTRAALEWLRSVVAAEDTIIVTGSFLTVGESLQYLKTDVASFTASSDTAIYS